MTLTRASDGMRTALVTGACSGIGLAMAERLGSLGYNLVLVSNRKKEIEDVATTISRRFQVDAHAVVLDLARPEAASELFAAVARLGLTIDILINNAGMFFFGEVADADPARANTLLQLHVVTPSLLCTLFAPGMRARRRGHILIVSSISAWRDFPGIAYYGSSKKYLLGFSRSLRSELAVYGVNVTCLAPGGTATGLYDPKVISVERGKRLHIMMGPDRVGDAGLRAMFARRAVCVPGALTRLMLLGARLTPQFVIDLIRRHAPWLRPVR